MSIRLKQRFYNKAVSIGIDLKELDVDKLDFSQPKKHKSSFKSRAKQIKELYNYQFNFRPEPRIVDLGIINIEFKRK
jgi:hypothetical protein